MTGDLLQFLFNLLVFSRIMHIFLQLGTFNVVFLRGQNSDVIFYGCHLAVNLVDFFIGFGRDGGSIPDSVK